MFIFKIESYAEIDTYINEHRLPAKDASEREKWAGSIDFQSAARLYNIVIFVCQLSTGWQKQHSPYEWRMYTPDMTDWVLS